MALGTIVSRYSPQDLEAVFEYMRGKRPLTEKFPKALPVIQSFEQWYQDLGWYARYVDTDETMQEARRRREELNDILGEKLPDTWVPADSPQAVPKAHPTPIIPTQYKVAAAVGAGVVSVLLLLTAAKKYVPGL